MKDDTLPELIYSTFKTDSGKELLENLIELYVVPSSYVRGDTHETAFRLGAESVVKMIAELSSEENNGRRNMA